ncbi:hypothetical protein ACIQF6_34860 [Kitasatospora sp. NPDC092948]|uniref:hypothetical protein n=1 Tax=Kitasatospora sp. NPDC092948 TaxID=3364088 RepID=UPI00380DC368
MISPQQLQEEPDRPRLCFVIGPIGDSYAAHGSPEREAYEHHVEVFERVIAPACEKYGIDAVRADGIANAGDINEQICRYIIESDLVVADVSGGNPNVMYELGIRHIIGKPTIHIGEVGQLPFDIAPIRTIQYRRSRSHMAEARRGIEGALEVGIRDGFELLTPARMMRAIQPVQQDEGVESTDEDDTPGLLDDFAAAEDGLLEIAERLTEITTAIATVGELTERSNAEVLDLVQANAPAGARLAAVARFADALCVPTGEMNTAAAAFSERMSVLDSGIRTALDLIEATPPEERDADTAHFLQQLITLDEESQAAMSQVVYFGTAAENMARLSRYLRKPVKDISTVVKHLTAGVTRIGEWGDKARRIAGGGTS